MGFDYAPAWRPDPGAIIDGTVTEITTYDGGGYGRYPIIVLRLHDGGEFAVHAFHTVLRNELARLDVQVGEHVAIFYGGPRETRSGDGSYESYRVKCPDRQPARFKWGGAAVDGEPTDGGDFDPTPAAVPADEDIPF
jgi:hypothetical protein